MAELPKDSEQRKTGSKGRQIFHSKLDTDHWEYKEETGSDVGRDCIIELSENNEWHNHKIECQIKGTAKPSELNGGKFISFPMEIKTINYALGSPIAFLLVLVDTTNQVVYYQAIQEYFIENPQFIDKLNSEQGKLSIHISKEKVVADKDDDLQRLAKTQYSRIGKNKLTAHEVDVDEK